MFFDLVRFDLNVSDNFANTYGKHGMWCVRERIYFVDSLLQMRIVVLTD